jgi:hypothetical protein
VFSYAGGIETLGSGVGMRAGIVVAVLLLVTSQAWAECAWVLWITVTEQRALARPADIVATYANAAECIGAIDHNERVYRSPSTVITRDARTMLHVDFRGQGRHFQELVQLSLRSGHSGRARTEGEMMLVADAMLIDLHHSKGGCWWGSSFPRQRKSFCSKRHRRANHY